ncbi:hypothetical protein, partial [Allocoleopsis sp.]|uniref:hypothetical protein n=1 Tax=Allocoleopsis sp. TaxID=3088169 RepID=UPI002FD6FC00
KALNNDNIDLLTAAWSLVEIGSEAAMAAAVPILCQELKPETYWSWSHGNIERLGKAGRPEFLPHLNQILRNKVLLGANRFEVDEVLNAIASIQEHCGYYNYEIALNN